MHLYGSGQKIVHDDQPNVLLVALIAEHAEEFGESRAGILLQVHVVTGQEFLQELRLLHAHCLQDELIVLGQVENRSRGPRV